MLIFTNAKTGEKIREKKMLSKINLQYANRYTVKIRFILAVLLTVTFFCIQGQSKTDKLLSQNKSIKSGSISAPHDIV